MPAKKTQKKNSDSESSPKRGDGLEGNVQGLVEIRQNRIDGGAASQERAWNDYKELAGDYASKSQVWKTAQETRDVRLSDLVKVHAHKPFDDKSAARVSKEAAKSVQAEKAALDNRRTAKAALDTAWETVRSFEDEAPVRPLIADDDEEEEGDEDDQE